MAFLWRRPVVGRLRIPREGRSIPTRHTKLSKNVPEPVDDEHSVVRKGKEEGRELVEDECKWLRTVSSWLLQ